MIRKLPTGEVREQHRGTSATKLRGIVERLQEQGLCGCVELRWPDCEGVLILPGDMRVFPVFQTGATDVRGQEALRQIMGRLEQRRADVQVIELPQPLGLLLGALSEHEPLHTGLHTAFVDLRKLARRLERDGFRGMVVVEGPGWWAFLPYDGSGPLGVYYDGRAAVRRDREELIDGLAGIGAEIEVWTAPDASLSEAAAPAKGWQAFKGTDTFIIAPALRPDDPLSSPAADLAEAFGPLGLELARALDGTRTLDQAAQSAGGEPDTVEPILLYLIQRKWVYRYISRRRPPT